MNLILHASQGRGLWLAMGLFLALWGQASASEVVLDPSLVYYGDPLQFSKPAIVDVQAVFAKIPEYRQIVDEDITPQDAKYWDLLNKANEKFYARLEEVAKAQDYDLICSAIQYSDGRAVPDITALVIEGIR